MIHGDSTPHVQAWRTLDYDADDNTSACKGCLGMGVIPVPRCRMDLTTGQVGTVEAPGRCRHCRDNPGRQNGSGPPA